MLWIATSVAPDTALSSELAFWKWVVLLRSFIAQSASAPTIRLTDTIYTRARMRELPLSDLWRRFRPPPRGRPKNRVARFMVPPFRSNVVADGIVIYLWVG